MATRRVRGIGRKQRGEGQAVQKARPGIALPEALEPRVLLDAAMVETAADLARDAAHDSAPVHDAGDIAELAAALAAPAQETRTQVYFIDAGVDGADALLAALPENAEVHTLAASSDGVAQIASVLEGRSGIDAIHILSHGRPGELTLGNAVLDAQSIEGSHAGELAAIGAALSAEADILIYGCDFAADLTGASAVEALARATGADIAASDDLTGASSLGGDWVLERHAGTVEADSLVASAFQGTLIDTDGDGVDDEFDIDDDGDGIIDDTELSISKVLSPAPLTPQLNGATLNFTSAGAAGNVGDTATYVNVGNYGGVDVDLRLTVVANSDPANMIINLDGTTESQGERVAFLLEGAATSGQAEIKVEFLISGTNTPFALEGQFTFVDIDSSPISGDELITIDQSFVGRYTVSDPTDITVETVGSDLVFKSTTIVSDITTPENAVTINTDILSSFNIRLDKRTTGTGYLFSDPVLPNATTTTVNVVNYDLDGDGVPEHRDLDTDNDGITNNVEAQSTAGYIAPSGVDIDGDGLDDAYDADTTSADPALSMGLTPVDTDGDGIVDMYDTDSDGDGVLDIAERGDGQATTVTSTTDTDQDGLLDIFEGADAADGHRSFDDNIDGSGNFNLAGVATLDPDGSNAIPLTRDLLFRDTNDAPVLAAGTGDVPVTEDVVATGNVLDGATDAEGDPITVSGFTVDGDATNYAPGQTAVIAGVGAVRINADGSYAFAPAPGYTGAVPAINYTATDGNGGNTPGTLQFANVTPANDAPVIDLDVADSTTNPPGIFPTTQLTTETDTGASGRIGDGATWVAGWTLTRTSATGYSPVMDTFTYDGGIVARAQDDAATGDSFAVEFTATAEPTSIVDAVVVGGKDAISSEPGTYTITWTGGGTAAVLSDPDGQIDNFNDGDIIMSGDVLHLAAATDTASWSVRVPSDNVAVEYVSDSGAETTNEDVIFRVIGHGTGTSATFTEGGPLVAGAQLDATVSSLGENDITSLSVVVAGRQDGANELLTIGGHTFDLSVNGSVSALDIGGSQVDIAYNATSATLTVTSTAGATTPIADADLSALVRTIAYENTSENPQGTVRNIFITATDADGLVSNTARARIAMAAVNDAPVIDLDGDNSTANPGTFPGIATTGNDGTTVAGTFGDGSTWGADFSLERTGSTGYLPGITPILEDGGLVARLLGTTGGNDSYQFSFDASPRENSIIDSIEVAPAGRATLGIDAGTFTLTWVGGGSATLSDPDGQISNFADGATIHSGDILNFPVGTGDTTWSVTVNSDNVSVDYAAIGETSNEQLIFRVNGRAAGASSTFTEDGGAVAIADADATLADLGEADITSLSVVATGMADGAAEQVVIAGQTVDLSQDASLSGITVGGTQVDIGYVAATGTFTVTNTAGATTPMAVADLDTLIAGMTYENTSQDPTGGVRSFAFTATDSAGLSSNTASASVDVVPVNDAPTGTADPIAVTEDTTAGPVNVLANLTDLEGDTITIASATIDTNGDGTPDALTLGTATPITDAGGNPIGTITVAADGNVTFEPAPDYDGAVPDLTFTPTDGTDEGAPVTVSFGTVTGVNDAPVAATDGPVTAVPGTVVNVDALANDTDADGDTLALTHIIDLADPGTQIALTVGTPVTLASGTTVTLKADGTLDLVMAQGVNDIESLRYVASDGNGGTGTGTITLARDSDGDGVANTDDLDDDNDGILDTVEYGTPAASPFYYAGVGELAVRTTPSSVTVHSTSGVGASVTYADALSFQGRSIDIVYTVVSQPVDQEYTFGVNGPGAALPEFNGTGQDYVFRLDFFEAGTSTPAAINFGTTFGDLDQPGGIAVDRDQIAAYHTRPTEPITVQDNGDEVRFLSTVDGDGQAVLLIGQAGRTSFTYTFIKEFGGSSHSVAAPTATGFSVPLAADTDGDGIADYLDLDSDNDGITDNVEAQATAGYTAPSGTDADGNGLDDAYESAPGAGEGLTPVDTDGDGRADVIDSDSDGDGMADIAERGDGGPVSVTDSTDTDGDGLLDIFEGADVNDGFDVNDGNVDGSGNFALEGVPALNADGSNAVPLTTDLLFRDTNDSPVTVTDTIPVTEDTTAGPVNVLANDTDADGDTLTIASASMDLDGDGTPDALTLGAATPVTDAGGNPIGTITVTADGNVTFEPAPDYDGAVPDLTYIATDGTVDSAPGTVSFGTVTGVNDAPVMNLDPDNDSGTPGDTSDDGADDGGYQVTFTEQESSFPIVDSDFVLTDAEDNIAEVVITLTNGLVGDMFSMSGAMPGGITGTVVPSTPLAADGTVTITLTGAPTTTSADWTVVIRDIIRFLPSATNPENPDPADRTITITATDSAFASSATLTTTIHVVPVNDAPVLDLDDDNGSGVAGGHYNGAYTENGAPAAISGGVLITDFDDTMLEGATIELTNGFAGDQLTVGTLPAGISLVGAAPGSLAGSGTITLELTGTATLADYQAAIAAITYSSVSENPDETTREITVSVNDGELDSAVRTASITVTAVNDAPTGSIAPVTVTEDTPVNGNVLTSVTDAEGDPVTVASASIDLDGDGTPDALTLGTPSDIVDAMGNPVGTIQVNADGSYTFTPAQDYNGPVPDLTIVPTDGTDDGAPLTLSFGTVVAVDDNPFIDLDGDDSSGAAGTGYEATFTEGLQGGVSLHDAADLVISDVDGVGIASLTVAFDGTFPDSGHEKLYPMNIVSTGAFFVEGGGARSATVLLDGVSYRFAFDGDQTITVTNADAGQSLTEEQARAALSFLRYGNTSEAPTEGQRTFAITVTDTRGFTATANASITVEGINDAASLTLDADASTGAANTNTVTRSATLSGSAGDLAGTLPDGTGFTVTGGGGVVRTGWTTIENPNAIETYGNRLAEMRLGAVNQPAIVAFPGGTVPDGTYLIVKDIDGTERVRIVDANGMTPTLVEQTDLYLGADSMDTPYDPVTGEASGPLDNSGLSDQLLVFDISGMQDFQIESLAGSFFQFSILGQQAVAENANAIFTEDGGAVAIADSDAALSDSGENDITSLTVVASGMADGASEQVVIAGETVDLSQDASLSGITVGGTQVDIAYVAATGTFTVTNTAGATTPMAAADLSAIIAGMTYENTSHDPTEGTRTFAVTATDADGVDTNTASASVEVGAVNDAPSGSIDPVTVASASIDLDGDGTPDALTLGTPSDIVDAMGNPVG
ncbi:MAG: hypothetical protein CMJ43_20955, partial [Phyllobacteriaceae bacterium]|nr:hypothetical protein [Phyllobacteriaceae bacterium]